MRVIRSKRGKLRHLTADLQLTLCSRRLKAPVLEPDAPPDCVRCLEIDLDINNKGN